MEAASARMVARDRYNGWAEPATTPLQRYIQNACDPQNFEPNLALDLEIADIINAKKGSTPREAAIAIVHHINNRNPNVSLLALTLLDICVKNCGYPFQLQISTKEFLNELVRRFPERPPIRASRVQHKILELIEEWRQTICQHSKYKEDLGFIRDMHRLLSYKGYMFPEIKKEDAAVLNPSDALRSAEEMEEEEKAAQSAKLQELIRRGTPHDLQEANKLMKVMAGYDTRHKTDYRAKAAEEVAQVQQKAKLLEEMLQHHSPGDDAINDNMWEEIGNALASAYPKIQKMCEEDSDDTEAVAKLLEINDSIHRTLERYRLTRKGDLEAAARIPRGTLGTSGAGVKHGANNELSLIDFGLEEEQHPANPVRLATAPVLSSTDTAVEDDLLGLSIQASTATSQPSTSLSLESMQSRFTNGASANQKSRENHDLLGSMSTLQQLAPSKKPAPHMIDPFASLPSSTSRMTTPFQFQQAVPGPSSSPNQAVLGSSTQLHRSVGTTPTTNPHDSRNSPDDEWTFASALPDHAHEIVVTNSTISVVFLVSRSSQASDVVLISSSVSNNTPQPISDLTFEIAVIKSYTSKLEPQSSRNLLPMQRAGITQTIELHGIPPGKATAVPVRWRTSYWLSGKQYKEEGKITSLGIN